MRRKALKGLFEPSYRLYFVVMCFFVLSTAVLGEYPLALTEGLVVLTLFLYFRINSSQNRKELLKYLEGVSSDMDVAAKDTMVNAPLPMVIFRPETEEIIWSNDRFLQITGDRDRLFDRRISDAVRGFDCRWLMEGKTHCPSEVRIGENRFQVYGRMVRSGDKGKQSFLATTYWVDVTELSRIRERYYESRPCLVLLVLDSYEEVFKGISDNVKSAMISDINRRIAEWAAPTGGTLVSYDRDRWLLLVEEKYLAGFIEKKFDVVDSVREVVNPHGLAATLSVAVGRDADSFGELHQFASLALEMALSRGGDQAVVKNRYNFEFYGDRTSETEKHTKVKSRVMASALYELIGDASQVFVMGHSFPDLDCIGPATGVLALARRRGTPAWIVRPTDPSPCDKMIDTLSRIPEYENSFLAPADALVALDPSSLLVVVDTNRPEQVLSRDLLDAAGKVAVVDHHRRAASYIDRAALSFQEPYASSASELMTELLQYVLEPTELLKAEAEALMAGIVLDTKNFTIRTGSRTFDAAAFLRRAGADTTQVRRFFENDLDQTISRYEIIKEAGMVREGIAVAAMTHPVGRVTAAQAADELLTVSGIRASFVLFPDTEGRIILSGRSLGEINVQTILEDLGGGGNASVAGAQIPGKTVEQVRRELLASIERHCEKKQPNTKGVV